MTGADRHQGLVDAFGLQAKLLTFAFLWMHWTLPRPRMDQLMSFDRKVPVPDTIVSLVVTAGADLAFPAFYR